MLTFVMRRISYHSGDSNYENNSNCHEQDLKARYPRCLRSESHLFSVVVVCNYQNRAGNEAHSDESYVFSHLSILFGPARLAKRTRKIGGAAGIRTRVQSGYYTRVYRHSPPKRTELI
jgi:hypothetical protein